MIEFGKCFGCGAIKEVNFSSGIQRCSECLQPKKIIEEQYSIPKISKKRQKKNGEYLKARREYLFNNPTCNVEGCSKDALEIHHKAGRENERLVDASGFLGVCPEHHRLIELSPDWAKKKGYSISRLKPLSK
jgi:hypothetical protein